MYHDTIAAVSTAPGVGGIAVIRLSGPDAFTISGKIFQGKDPSAAVSHTAHFGKVMDGEKILDEVVLTVFKSPNSFTGEDTVEIACHGSLYIQRELLQLLIRNGARMARPGEFSMRAYLNGKLDLSQAEAIGDLIAADHEAAHRVALQQMRGGYSERIRELRDELLRFASLIELELDFSEEDVTFADRSQLEELLSTIINTINNLTQSFTLGNVLRNGIPVAIAGAPNAGKSTLLNALLQDERALVSEVAGTTRDTVEEEFNLGGYKFRFIDTAGIRETGDVVEKMGISRTYRRIGEATIVLYLFDLNRPAKALQEELEMLKAHIKPNTFLVVVGNKADEAKALPELPGPSVHLSAKTGEGLNRLEEILLDYVKQQGGEDDQVMVTNVRHYEALIRARESLEQVRTGFASGLSGDLVSIDLKEAIVALGQIVGEISADEVLGAIFSKFCIGK